MNWDDLRYFLAVARYHTLSAAAIQMGVDATTIGRRIERLSTSLNATLFETTTSGNSLTISGQNLLVRAEEVERNMLEMGSEITGDRARLAGTVRISLSEGLATWVLAPHLAQFRELHPDITLEIVSTNGFLNPSKREVDLAILMARPIKGRLIAQKLTDYELGLYLAKSYIAKSGKPQSLADLHMHSLIGYIPDFIYAEELRYLSEIDGSLEPNLSSSSINVQHMMTRTNCGICVLPLFMGENDELLERVLAEKVTITRSFWIVVHQDLRRVARISAVLDWLGELVKTQRPSLLRR